MRGNVGDSQKVGMAGVGGPKSVQDALAVSCKNDDRDRGVQKTWSVASCRGWLRTGNRDGNRRPVPGLAGQKWVSRVGPLQFGFDIIEP